MLTHPKPQDPKNGKKWEEHKTPVKRGTFWPAPGGRRQGRAAPLSYGEERNCLTAMPRPGGPWPDFRALTLDQSAPPAHYYVGLDCHR